MRKIVLLGIAAILLFVMVNPAAAVVNGQPDGTGHPYVGLVVFLDSNNVPLWRCSGTLISPTVFVTAGHCTTTTSHAQIWFEQGPILNGNYPFDGSPCTGYTGYPCAGDVGGTPYTDPSYVNPSGPGLVRFDTHDVGVVVLDSPVSMAQYGLLPTLGQVDGLAMGTEITLVGYGVQDQIVGHGPPVWAGLKTRMTAPTMLVASQNSISNEYIKLTANPAQGKGGTCFGDSGGPDFIAGTNTFIAVNSFVTNGNCAGVTYSNRIDTAYALQFIGGFPPS